MKIIFFIYRIFTPLYKRGLLADAIIEKKRKCYGFETNENDYITLLKFQNLIITSKEYIKYQKEIS